MFESLSDFVDFICEVPARLQATRRLADMQADLDARGREAAAQAALARAAEAMLQRLQDEANALETETFQFAERNHRARAEAAEAQRLNVTLWSYYHQARQAAEAVRGELETARGELETARGELETARQELGEAWETVQFSRRARLEADRELETARGELETARGEAQRTSSEAQEAYEFIQRAQPQMRDAFERVAEANERVAAANEHLEACRNDLAVLTNQAFVHLTQLHQTRDELYQTRDELHQTRGELETARFELETARGEVVRMNLQIDTAVHRLAWLEDELRRVEGGLPPDHAAAGSPKRRRSP